MCSPTRANTAGHFFTATAAHHLREFAVVECDEGQASAVSAWLKSAMLDGMAPLVAPVPVEVEVKVARTWG